MKNTIKTNTPTNQKDYWRTSNQAYRDACYLCGVGQFEIDVAASEENKRCNHFLSESDDSLSTNWKFGSLRSVWCNPPFSRKVEFIKKAYDERHNALICMMLPYEPCTKWWRDNIDGKATVVYVPDGRYSYCHPETGKSVQGVNFSSAFVVFTSLTMPTQYVQFDRGVGGQYEFQQLQI